MGQHLEARGCHSKAGLMNNTASTPFMQGLQNHRTFSTTGRFTSCNQQMHYIDMHYINMHNGIKSRRQHSKSKKKQNNMATTRQVAGSASDRQAG